MGPAVPLPALAFQRYCRRPGNTMRERGMESQRHPRQSVPSQDGLWLTDPGSSLRGVRDNAVGASRTLLTDASLSAFWIRRKRMEAEAHPSRQRYALPQDEVICVARLVRGPPSHTLILRSRASGVSKDGPHTPTETLSCNRHRIFANTCRLQEREAICMNELGSSRP
ncbi:hypothetical protein LAL4801_04807 [Roseibium aggregatum]|uniref:Uncharacterized protein n=1 Tax=Roseibium aggregatum TaxID=187304 RepID=A0A0M6Y9K1_9HYPH|nr:hypothetical protein LAL4801_04807 [Roseibium aggregatum]